MDEKATHAGNTLYPADWCHGRNGLGGAGQRDIGLQRKSLILNRRTCRDNNRALPIPLRLLAACALFILTISMKWGK